MIHDALIVGGGPAGATVAWLLARAGWSVALLEKEVFPRRKVCGEFLSATLLPLFQHLGVEAVIREEAGPPVERIGLYDGAGLLAEPRSGRDRDRRLRCWGFALGRERLDALLLEGARSAGVEVVQPGNATGLVRDNGIWICQARPPGRAAETVYRGRTVIAAHGSREKGRLPTQTVKPGSQPADLLAFKAHLLEVDLADGLMPLFVFPGGYGGLVRTDHERFCLACCIRRDVLRQCRGRYGKRHRAAEALLVHIEQHCAGPARALQSSSRPGPWLASGPLRPGWHVLYRDGIFTVGNAAAEPHPLSGEGISMAMQGAWLLAEILSTYGPGPATVFTDRIGLAWSRAWKRRFARRLQISMMLAWLVMQPAASRRLTALFRHFPVAMTLCARLSGKTRRVLRSY